MRRTAERRRRRVLIIVQNLSVPMDRRVWQESRALTRAGIDVCVICPAAPGESHLETIEDVEIHRYRPPQPRPGVVGYLVEFVYCWLVTARLSLRCWRRGRFDAIQACNPPDTYWTLALLYRLRGVHFVYDQHDLCPEVFAVRFGTRRRLLGAGVLLLERATFAVADEVISTNESYRSVAIGRGQRDPGTVTVVRSGPDAAEMHRGPVRPELREGARHLLVYLGIMGPQDGVDVLLDAVHVLVHERQRKDIHVALLGFGDCLEALQAQCTDLGLDPWVTFTGRADKAMVRDYLSAASLGLCPDPWNPFNDVSTMNKVLEYMAHELPVVSFDLTESRVSAADAALYVADGDVEGFADGIVALLDDPARRGRMGRLGRARIEADLGWAAESEQYVSVYRRLLGEPAIDEEDRERRAMEEVA